MTKALIFIIKGYRRFISPLFTPTCRFTPSCSSYAIQSLEKHRLFKGSWLVVKRLSRCHPLNEGGHDPVP